MDLLVHKNKSLRIQEVLVLILTKKTRDEDVITKDIEDSEYANICQEDIWRISMIKELNDIKFSQLELGWFYNEESVEIWILPVFPGGWLIKWQLDSFCPFSTSSLSMVSGAVPFTKNICSSPYIICKPVLCL